MGRLKRIVHRLPLGRRAWRFAWSLERHGVFRAASAMAFDAFLATIPMFALFGWTVHRFGGQDVLLTLYLGLAPGPAAQIADPNFLRLSDDAVVTLAPLSGVVFLWLSSSGVAAAIDVCEHMFESEDRPFWRRRIIAFAWVGAGLAVVAVGTPLAVFFSQLLGAARARLALSATLLPVLVGLVVAFFRTAIRRPRGMRRRVLPGAVVTVGLWLVVSIAFSYYVSAIASYSLFYGGLAAVAMVLVWFWLMSMALLVGGEVNAQLEGVREFPPSTVMGR